MGRVYSKTTLGLVPLFSLKHSGSWHTWGNRHRHCRPESIQPIILLSICWKKGRGKITAWCLCFPADSWLSVQCWSPNHANTVSSDAHWHCTQLWSPPSYFLPFNMAGLFDDYPPVWTFLELSPEVSSHPPPPLGVSWVIQHARTWVSLHHQEMIARCSALLKVNYFSSCFCLQSPGIKSPSTFWNALQ